MRSGTALCALAFAAVRFGSPRARHGVRPGIGRQGICAHVPADHRVAGMGLAPLGLHQVSHRAVAASSLRAILRNEEPPGD